MNASSKLDIATSHTSVIPKGVWPVMLTPFTDSGAVDWNALDTLIEWYIEAGVSGLFSVCLSSEMYQLNHAERLEVARRVVKRAAGRVPVVATGTFGGAIELQSEMTKRIADTGTSAVVVISNQLAALEEDDCVWQSRAEALIEATGDIPLGLYECPVPYKRLLSPALLGWAASSGRFVFHKDTACNMADIKAKLSAVQGTEFRWLNANCPTLLESLKCGGDGYCGIAANFMPELYVWLCKNYKSQPETAEKLQRFMSVADAVIRYKYPASAKHFLVKAGIISCSNCRIGNPELVEEDQIILHDLQESIVEWRQLLR